MDGEIIFEGDPKVIEILKQSGAVLVGGHFVLQKGEHSPGYVDKDIVGVDPHDLDVVAEAMANLFRGDRIGVVIGPQAGGVGLASRVAGHIGNGCRSIYAEKKEGGGFKIERAAHVEVLADCAREDLGILISEDISTTGDSIDQVADAALDVVRAAAEKVFASRLAVADAVKMTMRKVYASVICNRGGVTVDSLKNVKIFRAVTTVTGIKKYPAAGCPLCSDGVPIRTDRGHGQKFLDEQAAREGGQ